MRSRTARVRYSTSCPLTVLRDLPDHAVRSSPSWARSLPASVSSSRGRTPPTLSLSRRGDGGVLVSYEFADVGLRAVFRTVRATFRPVFRATRATFRPVFLSARATFRPVLLATRAVLRAVSRVVRAVVLLVAIVFLPFCFDASVYSSESAFIEWLHFLQTLPWHMASQLLFTGRSRLKCCASPPICRASTTRGSASTDTPRRPPSTEHVMLGIPIMLGIPMSASQRISRGLRRLSAVVALIVPTLVLAQDKSAVLANCKLKAFDMYRPSGEYMLPQLAVSLRSSLLALWYAYRPSYYRPLPALRRRAWSLLRCRAWCLRMLWLRQQLVMRWRIWKAGRHR